MSDTVDAIVAGAMSTRAQLAALDHTLQGAIDELQLNAARLGRTLTDDERNRRIALRAQQAEVRDAFAELGFATAARLDQSDEIKQLHAALSSINANLSDDLDRLKRIAAYAAIAAQVADGLAKLAEQVAGLVAKA